MSSTLQVNAQQQTNAPVQLMHVSGRLDAGTVNIMEKALSDALAKGNKVLVLDLADLAYISSSGLRALLTARRAAHARKGDVLISSMKRSVRDVFDMVGFSAVFGIHDNVEQALRAATKIAGPT
jgi:anti-sigma B factor antagonist